MTDEQGVSQPTGWGFLRRNGKGEQEVSRTDKALCELATSWDRNRTYTPAVDGQYIAVKVSQRSSSEFSVVLFESLQHFRAYMEGVLDALDNQPAWSWERDRRKK